jgi:putative nucleotidyltransferase with HDIG domain
MSNPLQVIRRLKLRHVLFVSLLLAGIVPLTISNLLLLEKNRDLLEVEEQASLLRSAQALSRELSKDLAHLREQLQQVGIGLLLTPGPEVVVERLQEPWVVEYLQSFALAHPDLVALRVLDRDGVGARLGPGALPSVFAAALNVVFSGARSQNRPVYRFVIGPGAEESMVALAVPLTVDSTEARLVVEALFRFRLVEAALEREVGQGVGVFIIDRDGSLLWSRNSSPETERAFRASELLGDFVKKPLNLTSEFVVEEEGRPRRTLAWVSPVPETGWGIVVHKPRSAAFEATRQMIFNTVLASVLLVVLALFLALAVARGLSRPIQRLAETSHEIAAGNFGQRVEAESLGFELADLARDFNRMSDHVERYVEELRQAAQTNRELFIGSIRAFAAAIDAKDPYTRGHSERVAAYSRSIAQYLSLSEGVSYRLWVGALLHDIGKIGIGDSILNKEGVYTPEEYDQMKLHTVKGAEILSPIEQLREMIPLVRWHHENWNGRGYPDSLRGEEIPLLARVVAVADTFDAITTARPYQRTYELEEAVQTITKLTGSRFDAKVVTAFLTAYEEGEIFVLDQVPDLADASVAENVSLVG